MNCRTLSRVGLGLLGVWALLQATLGFLSIASVLVTTEKPGEVRSMLLAMGLPIAALLGLSYVLMFHNGAVANVLFPDLPTSAEPDAAGRPRLLVGLLGVFLLGIAIPDLVRVVVSFVLVPAAQMFPGAWRRFQIRELIAPCIQTGLAVFLILRPNRVLTLWHLPTTDRAA